MAGKKSKRKGYKSAGIVGTTGLRQSATQRAHHTHTAWAAGKNPWVTIEGTATNMPFVRVRANAHWGKPPMAGSSWKGGAD